MEIIRHQGVPTHAHYLCACADSSGLIRASNERHSCGWTDLRDVLGLVEIHCLKYVSFWASIGLATTQEKSNVFHLYQFYDKYRESSESWFSHLKNINSCRVRSRILLVCLINYAENVPFWRPFCFGWPSAHIQAAKRWSPCRGRPHPLAPRGKSSRRAPVPLGSLLRQFLPAMLVLVYPTRGRTWRLSTLFHAWNITQHTRREKIAFYLVSQFSCHSVSLGSFRHRYRN